MIIFLYAIYVQGLERSGSLILQEFVAYVGGGRPWLVLQLVLHSKHAYGRNGMVFSSLNGHNGIASKCNMFKVRCLHANAIRDGHGV